MKIKRILVYLLLSISICSYVFAFFSKGDNQMLGMMLGGLTILPAGILYMLWLFKMPGRNWNEEKKQKVQKQMEEIMESHNNSTSTIIIIGLYFGLLHPVVEGFWKKNQDTIIGIGIVILSLLLLFFAIKVLNYLIREIRSGIVNLISDAIKKSRK